MSINSVVESAGIEFECGINNRKYRNVEKFFDKWHLKDRLMSGRDPSVAVYEPGREIQDRDWRASAEIAFWSDKKIDLIHFLQYMGKAGARTNDTCGMHVHVKFKNMARGVAVFASCAVRQRFDEMYVAYANTIPEYTRLFMRRMTTHYSDATCSQSIIKQQLKANTHYDQSRYHQVNLAALYRTGTVEFRILPGMEWPLNKQNFLWLMSTVEKLYKQSYNKKAILEHYGALLYSIQPGGIGRLPSWIPYDEKIKKDYVNAGRQLRTSIRSTEFLDVLS